MAKSFGLTDSELLANFKPAREDQLKQVCQLRQQVFGGFDPQEDERYLKWRYLSHPKCDSCLWVFEHNDKVIAAIGCEPVELVCEDKTLDAIRSMDIIVAPEYDGRGLGAWMNLYMQTHHACVLASGATESSFSMLKKMTTSLPVRKNYRLLFKTQHLIANKLGSPLAAVFVAPVLDTWLKIKRTVCRAKLNNLENHLTIREIQSVDELIAKLPDHQGVLGEVKVLRNKDYLRWRYGNNPNYQFNIHGLFSNNQLIGYVISRITNEDQSIQGDILDWDLFEQENQANRLAHLFISAVDNAITLGAEYMLILLNDEITEESIRNIGFGLTKIDSRFFIHCNHPEEWAPIFEAKNWYQSFSDFDGF